MHITPRLHVHTSGKVLGVHSAVAEEHIVQERLCPVAAASTTALTRRGGQVGAHSGCVRLCPGRSRKQQRVEDKGAGWIRWVEGGGWKRLKLRVGIPLTFDSADPSTALCTASSCSRPSCIRHARTASLSRVSLRAWPSKACAPGEGHRTRVPACLCALPWSD